MIGWGVVESAFVAVDMPFYGPLISRGWAGEGEMFDSGVMRGVGTSIDAAGGVGEAIEHRLVGRSPAIEAVKAIAATVAHRRSTVLLQGETGAGKEVIARHIHRCSPRIDEPFVAVDCSALPDTLFESQMFGHVRGAFTGALRDTLGFIRAADGGTLFLDEIGELTLAMQAKLLRVLQERSVIPVGASTAIKVDVRLVCATNRNLTDMVREGTFRQDLYYRLGVVVLQIPPLRERREDILMLCRHFLGMQANLYGEMPRHLAADAQAALVRFDWPGNVRELANAMEHAHVLAGGDEIALADLPERLRRPMAGGGAVEGGLLMVDVERRAISDALRRTKGNKTAAGRMLGMAVQRMRRRMTALGIEG